MLWPNAIERTNPLTLSTGLGVAGWELNKLQGEAEEFIKAHPTIP